MRTMGWSSGSPTPRPGGPALAGVRINDVLVERRRLRSPGCGTIATCWHGSSPTAESRRRPPRGRPPAPTCRRPPAAAARCPRSPTCSPARTMRSCSSISRPASSRRVDTETGQVERIGAPAIITDASASPDEKYVLVNTARRPFSYRVPYEYFTRKTEVWDAAGRPVATVADLPISDEIPRQGVPTGPEGGRLAAPARRPADLDRGPRRRRPAVQGPSPRQGHGTGRTVRRSRRGDEGQASAHGPGLAGEKDHALVTEFDRDRRWRTTTLVDLTSPTHRARSSST